jgi:F0F1-type ATP synthase membrane subunit b/b'
MTFLQIFLIINAFIIGGLLTIAVQHAYAHFHPQKIEEKKVPAMTQDRTARLPIEVREQLLADAHKKYQLMLDRAGNELEKDLASTSGMLTDQLKRIGAKIVNDELEQYKGTLRDMHVQADEAINGGRKDIATYQQEMREKLTAEVSVEKERLVGLIDTSLSDAVTSFLIETLQHDVDLGAQAPYLTKMLEEHKDEFKKSVADEN